MPLLLSRAGLVAGVVALGCSPSPAADERRHEAGAAPVAAAAAAAAAGAGEGLVVWESNRSGEWRLWTSDLAGRDPRQLSRDEPGRTHCCAHLSPAGDAVAYLSLAGERRQYAEPHDAVGELRLLPLAGGRERVLAPAARHYGEHRAALWWSADELVYIDGAGVTRHLDLSLGAARPLVRGPERGQGYLVDPSGRWATTGTPTFSEVVAGEVRQVTPLGGCQPYFDATGQIGYWSAGAGGPIDAIDLASRRTWTILAKHDPRLPADHGYLYFPMLSRDRTLLAVAGSPDQHDHFEGDYEVFLLELDPVTLQPKGAAVRVTRHPAVDRFPDVWRRPRAGSARVVPPPEAAPELSASGWPASGDGLVFLWEGADRLNRRAPGAASEVLAARGEAWFDRRGRMALGGGWFEADGESARRVNAELKAANRVTVELVVEPAAPAGGPERPLLALATNPRQRGLLVSLRDGELLVRVRTGETGPGGGAPATLGRLPARGAHHVAFSYSPNRLRTYVDGKPAGTPAWAADFFPWRNRALTFGAEPGGGARFRGALSHVAIFARELPAAAIAADAERALAALAAAPAPPRLAVVARLAGRARVPRLEEVSPYRSALVVERWRVERTVAGTAPAGGELRVARWALLDGAPTAAMALAPGARAELELEPYDAQPQLAEIYLGDDGGAGPLWFAVGLGAER